MDIKEAINHCYEAARRMLADDPCSACAEEHKQLAHWLEELLAYRALGPVEELAALVKARDDGRVVVLEDVTAHQANTIMGMCERLNAMKARHGDDQEPLITWQLYNALMKSFTRTEAEAALSCQKCRESGEAKVCEDKRTGYVCPNKAALSGGGNQ